MEFTVNAGTAQECPLADFLKTVRESEFTGEIASGERAVPIAEVAVIVADSLERARKIQAAAETRTAPERRLVDELKSLRKSQGAGESVAVGERGLVDSLQAVGKND